MDDEIKQVRKADTETEMQHCSIYSKYQYSESGKQF